MPHTLLQDASIPFTGTRFYTSQVNATSRLQGTTEYVSSGVDADAKSFTNAGEGDISVLHSCLSLTAGRHYAIQWL